MVFQTCVVQVLCELIWLPSRPGFWQSRLACTSWMASWLRCLLPSSDSPQCLSPNRLQLPFVVILGEPWGLHTCERENDILGRKVFFFFIFYILFPTAQLKISTVTNNEKEVSFHMPSPHVSGHVFTPPHGWDKIKLCICFLFNHRSRSK